MKPCKSEIYHTVVYLANEPRSYIKTAGKFILAEDLLACQEELCSVAFVKYIITISTSVDIIKNYNLISILHYGEGHRSAKYRMIKKPLCACTRRVLYYAASVKFTSGGIRTSVTCPCGSLQTPYVLYTHCDLHVNLYPTSDKCTLLHPYWLGTAVDVS
jgi:hypothetical protein